MKATIQVQSILFISYLCLIIVCFLLSFLVVLVMILIVLVMVSADLFSGVVPSQMLLKQYCKYNLTELTKSKRTFCNSVLSLYIITITKNTQFSKFAYNFSKNSFEYSRCWQLLYLFLLWCFLSVLTFSDLLKPNCIRTF